MPSTHFENLDVDGIPSNSKIYKIIFSNTKGV
jgi:hypothetical protein